MPESRRKLPSPTALKRLLPLVRPHRWALAFASLCLVIGAAGNLSLPLFMGRMLDSAFAHADRSLIDRIALGLLALVLLQAAMNYAQAYLLAATGERAVAGLRRQLFSRLLNQPPGFFAERRTGELTSRLTADIGMLQGTVSHQVAEFSRQVLTLIGAVTMLILTQPRLTLTALAVVPVAVLVAVVLGRRLRKMSVSVQDKVAESTAVAEEAFSQIRTVQSFAREEWERTRFSDRVTEVVDAALVRARVRGVFFGALTFAAFAAAVIVLWQGGVLVTEGKLTAGRLFTFLVYTLSIAGSVGGLATFVSNYQESVGAAERVFQLLELPSPIMDPAQPVSLPDPVQGRVTFEQVSFRYHDTPETPWALQDLSLELPPGGVVALVGPSGAGKTTVASLLPRFWDVSSGSIAIDGIDVRRLRLDDLRRAIGLVPQEPALFSGTIRENIAYARPEASLAEVEVAARAAHAAEFIERVPGGYQAIVGERGIKLSGGQRQRIALARAILKDPRILILDEATSSLDTESERLIEDALDRLLTGRTTLIIAHRLSTVRRADRIVVLDRGRIVEQGTHGSLLALGGLYARLYQQQFREEPAPAS
jgi:subfamily B ATP-binding cassette protein MsbA